MLLSPFCEENNLSPRTWELLTVGCYRARSGIVKEPSTLTISKAQYPESRNQSACMMVIKLVLHRDAREDPKITDLHRHQIQDVRRSTHAHCLSPLKAQFWEGPCNVATRSSTTHIRYDTCTAPLPPPSGTRAGCPAWTLARRASSDSLDPCATCTSSFLIVMP